MTADSTSDEWLASRDLGTVMGRLHRLYAIRPDRQDAQWTITAEIASALDGIRRWGSLDACSFLGHTLRNRPDLLPQTSLAQLSGALYFEWRAAHWGSGFLEQAMLVAGEIRSRLAEDHTGDEHGFVFAELYGAVLSDFREKRGR